MKVYLSGPIQAETDEDKTGWRETAKEELVGFHCLDPLRRRFKGDDLASQNEIVAFDRKDVEDADILLVNFDRLSVGTSMEVFYAHQLGKFVITFSTMPKEKQSPWMIRHSTTIQPSLYEAIAYIKKYFSGEE